MTPPDPTTLSRSFTSQEQSRLNTFIDQNLAKRLTLRSLAEAMAMSVSHLNRLMRRTFGRRPCEYVIVRRVERAKDLMRRMGPGQVSLVEIAARCGFADQSHFSRQFKRVVGMTPRAYCATLRAHA
jgi:AraC family transcriptional regulator